jgi:hypothetical protein
VSQTPGLQRLVVTIIKAIAMYTDSMAALQTLIVSMVYAIGCW